MEQAQGLLTGFLPGGTKGMCSRNAHRSVLQFLMGTRTRLESACRKMDSVSILHFPWASCAVFPTNVDLVVRKWFFCCLKPNCLHFCCFCTPFEKGPLHLPAPLSADPALITTAPMDAQRETVLPRRALNPIPPQHRSYQML